MLVHYPEGLWDERNTVLLYTRAFAVGVAVGLMGPELLLKVLFVGFIRLT